jgi:hypothetical protein
VENRNRCEQTSPRLCRSRKVQKSTKGTADEHGFYADGLAVSAISQNRPFRLPALVLDAGVAVKRWLR